MKHFKFKVLKLACEGGLNAKTTCEVTVIEQNPKKLNKISVGYLDGSLRIFDLNSKNVDASSLTLTSELTFNGHKTSITSLAFDKEGVRLVSGSKDTDLVLWDLVGECGLFRLKGHKAPISKALFMSRTNVLISWLVELDISLNKIICYFISR